MIAVIDNYDSFTFNIVQYLGELGAETRVFRNDQVSVSELAQMNPERLLLSPGPGRPDNAGITLESLQYFAGRIPVLGVCLGHQSIGQFFGGTIVHASEIMHGKLSTIHHTNLGVFNTLAPVFEATRYHSLVVEKKSLPDCLEVTSWTENATGEFDEIMGLRHKSLDVEGVQFHPESISSEYGHQLLLNFLQGENRS